MSVGNSSLVSPSRNTSFTVQLSPYLVETLCELTRATRAKTRSPNDADGVLLGTTEYGITVIEALKTFEDSGPRSDLARRERMDKAFDAALADAKSDPEVAPMKVVGWFCFRSASGLLTSDVDFHNRRLKNFEDLALIVREETRSQVILELYARAPNGVLSGQECRWSSICLSTELRRIGEPIDLAMRPKVSGDSYTRAYPAEGEPDEGADRKKIASSAKQRLMSLVPEPLRAAVPSVDGQQHNGAYVYTGSAALTTFSPARRRLSQPRGVSGLPMVIEKKKPKRPGVPWLSSALVFLVFCLVTFGVMAVRGLELGNNKLTEILRVVFPGTDLNLHVESQGDRLLLSWNRRNPTVASAADGTLQIFDGAQHREVPLNGAQIADGSVLYKPVTNDVTFRLEVHGTDQSIAQGSMRVLDATSLAANGHPGQALDLSDPSPASGQTSARPGAPQPASASTELANRIAWPTSGNPRTPLSGREGRPVVSAPASLPVESPQRAQVNTPRSPDGDSKQPAQALGSPAENVSARQNSNEPETGSAAADGAAAQNAPVQTSRIIRQDGQKQAEGQSEPGTSTINGWDANISDNASPPPAPLPESSGTKVLADARSVAFVPPRPLLQVMPNVKALSPGAINQVTRVAVEVRIDTEGHVTSTHIVNPGGNVKGTLSNAALSAARQWTFQPATLHGTRVESDHTIVFEFRPEKPE